MRASAALATLDRMLASYGVAATLNRGDLAAPTSVSLRVHLVGYRATEIIAGSGLQVGDTRAIWSATPIRAAGWPGAGSAVPKKGDWFVIDGRNRMVIAAWEAPRVGGEVVRYEAQIR